MGYMLRYDEIIEASKRYDTCEDAVLSKEQLAFIAGANWADNNPMNAKIRELHPDFTVEDMIMPSDEPEYPGEYEEPEESGNAKKIVLICAVAAVLAAVIVTVIIIVLKKKKKAKVEIPDSFDWEDANQTNQR